ncbi:hypothetical protein FJT64_020252 [Amphibalanus amphitrite]|uniref:Uncharacterized protein n=1 Tax=Amphibalanus amphitrite TaxID=1232801 RepID=A0A6A4WXF0_AMPAM|nr:hypothetical protein FJT64_020252 [Amphibalanus amphitrite]
MCVFLCWKSRVAFGWRLDCALGEWITMGGNRKDATSRKMNLQCTRDSREKLRARSYRRRCRHHQQSRARTPIGYRRRRVRRWTSLSLAVLKTLPRKTVSSG